MTADILLGAGPAVLAFDVGGTRIKGALLDDAGRPREEVRVDTPHDGERTAERVVETVAALARELGGRHPDVAPAAAGLLVPGVVDPVAGVGIHSENLGWRDFPFRDRAAAALGMPVAFDHDVRDAGEAEHRVGAAAEYDDVLVVTIGTGIAAAVFVGGVGYSAGGLAGEIGHLRVADGPDCRCGARGCLEAVASAAALVRRYEHRTGVALPGAAELLELVSGGDPHATEIWDDALDALASAFSACVAVLAPQAIVVGGGLSDAGDRLIAPVRERLDALLTFQRRPVLLRARTGSAAGLLGAALAARDLAEARRA
jgi:glucokinase